MKDGHRQRTVSSRILAPAAFSSGHPYGSTEHAEDTICGPDSSILEWSLTPFGSGHPDDIHAFAKVGAAL
jgi:hypothetical protein